MTIRAFQNAKKKWRELDLGTPNQRLLLEFKALLHSIICGDGGELKWLSRVNASLRNVSVENLYIHDDKSKFARLGLEQNGNRSEISDFLNHWISPLISEKRKKIELLTPKFKNALNRIDLSLDKLEMFHEYLGKLAKGVKLDDYTELESDSPEVKQCFRQLENARKRRVWDGNKGEPNSIILGIEKGRLRSFLGGDIFQLNITSENPSK